MYTKKEIKQMADNKIFANMTMAQLKRRTAETDIPISFGDKRDAETAHRHSIDYAEREKLIYEYIYNLILQDAT